MFSSRFVVVVVVVVAARFVASHASRCTRRAETSVTEKRWMIPPRARYRPRARGRISRAVCARRTKNVVRSLRRARGGIAGAVARDWVRRGDMTLFFPREAET